MILSKDLIHGRFEAQAALTPEAVAVNLADRRLTYRELNHRANQLAHYLRARNIGPDVFVGICSDRTVELVVGLLGILKAGGTYVPIDPQYPPERRAFMLQDSKSSIILTERAFAGDFADPATPIVLLDDDWPAIARESGANPENLVGPDNLAYVIYTSGSTGVPKGTLISHRNVVRLFDATHAWFEFGPTDVWTLFHSVAFDFSVWELWGALFYGGRLVVVPFGLSRSPHEFRRLLDAEGVTILNQTPSAFRQLMRADEVAAGTPALQLRYVIFGGEALDLASLRPWFDRHGDAHPRLVNMYGITETTVHVTYRPVGAADLDAGSVIGKPIPDLQIHLLDSQQQPVAAGEPGEIHVGGAGVSRGYLNRPELTAQRFIDNPFSAHPGERLYRSGDLARYLPSGDLEYLGRIDQQVKIRGFRIELGEIAAELNRCEGVRDSVVIVVDSPSGEKALAAYLVRQTQAPVDIADIRRRLRVRLPEYMVPASLTCIDALPLTVNGKLDVKALPAADRNPGLAPVAGLPEATPLQRSIREIWRDILQINEPGLDQNFFDVGGTSLHVAEVHARLQAVLGREFSITELFAHSTIRALAGHFSSEVPTAETTEARLRAQRQRNALSAQRNRRHHST